MSKKTLTVEFPEFREYAREKYPELNEGMITMIEDLILRESGGKGAIRVV